jgi:hypothetical protein
MKKYRVLIITPATVRPEIVQKTFTSFYEKLVVPSQIQAKSLDIDLRISMAIHIDAIGDTCDRRICRTPLDIHLMAQHFFKVDYVHKNFKDHSFPLAFTHLWLHAANSRADYVFYLEDDWLLLEEVNLIDMISIMESNPTLATLRLPFRETNVGFFENWKHRFPWTGQYFKCPAEIKGSIGWCGHPGLVNMNFIRNTVTVLDPSWCPELQMKGRVMPKIISCFDYGVYGIPAGPKYVQDIGREWRAKRNIIKQKISCEWKVA